LACAPRQTPAAIIDGLNREINAALEDPKLKTRLVDLGGTLIAGSPADFGKLIADDTEKWGKLIRAAKIAPPHVLSSGRGFTRYHIVEKPCCASQHFGPPDFRNGSMVLIKSPMRGLRLCIGALARNFDLIFLNAPVGAGLH
jgi:hypothetical protein